MFLYIQSAMPVDLKKIPVLRVAGDARGSVVDLPNLSFIREIPNNAADDMQLRVLNCARQDTHLGNEEV